MKYDLILPIPNSDLFEAFYEARAVIVNVAPHLTDWTFCVYKALDGRSYGKYRCANVETTAKVATGATTDIACANAAEKLALITPKKMAVLVKLYREWEKKRYRHMWNRWTQ